MMGVFLGLANLPSRLINQAAIIASFATDNHMHGNMIISTRAKLGSVNFVFAVGPCMTANMHSNTPGLEPWTSPGKH